MQHPLPLEASLKNEPPPHPGEDQSSKRAKLDEILLPPDSMEAPSDSMEAESSPNPPLSEHVPETPPSQSAQDFQHTQDTQMDGNTAAANPVPSFKDKLLNSDTTAPDEDDPDFLLRQGDVAIGLNGNIPTVDFASHVLEALNKRIGLAVVVKLLGRRIGYRYLHSKLQSLWKPSGQLKLTDLHDDCFLVRFNDDMDYQNALLNGPWVIFGHYLHVQPWSPSFRPQEHVIDQIVGWIRLPKLPVRYYHKNIIRSIGSVFGDVIRVDYNTDSGDRGKFARLAVNIDLTKPLTSRIQVDGELILVEYEGLPSICFNCGRYGHLKEACPMNLASTGGVQPENSSAPAQKEGSVVTDMLPGENADFGEWMQQLPIAPDKGYPLPIPDASFQKKKGKELKGTPKSNPNSSHKQPQPTKPNQDCVFNSTHYATRATSLDTNYNSAVLVNDPRLPRYRQEAQVPFDGPIQQPNLGNDPFSKSRGFKLASGVTIHNLGAKPNLHVAGPSTHYMKDVARQVNPDSATAGMR
ncbi:hypothetical protein K1719_027132 [Acacia pycnantha]|nr:hypothetical protein K1719_027132 [Acacia pycnantha]